MQKAEVQKEAEAVSSIQLNLEAMKSFSDEFAHAVSLFEYSGLQEARTGSNIFTRFQFIAAKQAILALYNYRMAMDAAVALRRSCPAFTKKIDNSSLERAKERFRTEFPKLKELRQTLLHTAELSATPERLKTLSLREEVMVVSGPWGVNLGAGSVLGDCSLVMNQYVSAFHGETVMLEVSGAKARLLIDIARDFFGAFPSE